MFTHKKIEIDRYYCENEENDPTIIHVVPSGFPGSYNIIEEDPIFGHEILNKNQKELDEYLTKLKRHFG